MAQTTVRLRHDMNLVGEAAVCRMQLHCTIATTLNTRLTAMCPALYVRPFAKAVVIVLQGVESGQTSSEQRHLHLPSSMSWKMSAFKAAGTNENMTCWMANADGSAHCLFELTGLDPLQDSNGWSVRKRGHNA